MAAAKSPSPDRVVYTTEDGSICAGCQKPAAKCACQAQRAALVVGDGNVRVRREIKGRAGKTVSTITGLAMPLQGLEQLLTLLKRRCACGGSIQDGVLLIQGDHCELLLQELSKQGIKAKRAGG